MAQREQIKREGSEELEEENCQKKKTPQPLYDQLKAPDEGMLDFQVEPSVDDHAALLADIRSDEQRANMVKQLQQSYGNAYVQRVIERIQAEKGSGQPLEPEMRSEMESSFGEDFGGVRIHADTTADKLAKELGAKAFTSGKDVFFREGIYQPTSEGGEKLLGHELTHVVQQEGGVKAGNAIGEVSDALEKEATRVGEAVSKGRPVSVETASAVPALQRQATAEAPAEATAEAKAPAAEEGADKARLAVLKVMFEAAVVGPLRNAYEALGQEKPDAKAAYKNVRASFDVIRGMLSPYEGVEPMYSRLVATGNALLTIGNCIEPHIGITRPLSELRKTLNPDGEVMPKYFEKIRSQF